MLDILVDKRVMTREKEDMKINPKGKRLLFSLSYSIHFKPYTY